MERGAWEHVVRHEQEGKAVAGLGAGRAIAGCERERERGGGTGQEGGEGWTGWCERKVVQLGYLKVQYHCTASTSVRTFASSFGGLLVGCCWCVCD